MTSRNGYITGEIAYAQATWFTKPNHDLASVRVLGVVLDSCQNMVIWENTKGCNFKTGKFN